jgi:acetyl-CoA C-acetyltransferase
VRPEIVAISAVRTPLGSFGGAFRDTPVVELGAAAIAAALRRAGVNGADVDEVVYANCRQAGNGPNPARTASVKGGVPVPVPASTVNMACPSSMKTVMLACQSLATGAARLVVAGGMESMSTMPYLLKNARWEGFKLGDKTLLDSWADTIDPLCGYGMGMTAENLAEKYRISREAQDQFAAESHARAARAQDAGIFDAEIEPVRLPPTRNDPDGAVVSKDEGIRRDTGVAKLARLKPVFKKDGTVTAGNSCSMGDGACALVLTTKEHAAAIGASPLFAVVSFAQTAVEPSLMGEGPAQVIPLALQRAGFALRDMDFIEVNEAFAVQMLANERVLEWDRARVNVHGGGVALGHPTGMSGARILVALDNVLRRRDGEHGVAAICGGGGVTTAMVIRRLR